MLYRASDGQEKTRLVAGDGKLTNCQIFYAKGIPATKVWGV